MDLVLKTFPILNSNLLGKDLWSNLYIWKSKCGLIRTGILKNGYFEDNKCNPDDIGDYLPGILLWGINKKEVTDWVYNYIYNWHNNYKTKIGLFASVNSETCKIFPKNSFIDNTDTIYGLISLYLLDKKEIYLQAAEYIAEALQKYGLSKKGFVYNYVSNNGIPILKKGYISHLPVVSNYYAESLCKLYELTGKKTYLLTAKKIIYAWLNTKWFKKYSLCIDRIYPFGILPRSINATLTKSNTYFGYATLYYGRLTGDFYSLKKLLLGLENFKDQFGFYSTVWNHRKGIVNPNCSITYIKSLIDLYLDVSVYLKDQSFYYKSLDLINMIKFSNFNLAEENINKNANNFVLDSQTDLLLLFSKFYSIDKKSIWKKHSNKILSGINNFYNGKYYCNYINAGKLIDQASVKYQGLLLKSVITTEKVFNGDFKFYSKSFLDWVCVDR